MVKTQASIETNEASRFLRMLCKHFAHKVSADWDDNTGWVEFAMGRCDMTAAANSLNVVCSAENEADLDMVADTMKSHFDRFAQRQGLTLNWD
jgi:hypothetical protein